MTHWETSIWLKCLRTFRHGDHVSPIIHHSTSSHIAPHYPDIIPHNRVMHPAMFSRARHIIHHRVEAKNLRARGQKHSRKPWSRKSTMSAGRFILGFYLITKSIIQVICILMCCVHPLKHNAPCPTFPCDFMVFQRQPQPPFCRSPRTAACLHWCVHPPASPELRTA